MIELNQGGQALIDHERTHRTQSEISLAIFVVSRGEKGLGHRLIISFQFPYVKHRFTSQASED